MPNSLYRLSVWGLPGITWNEKNCLLGSIIEIISLGISPENIRKEKKSAFTVSWMLVPFPFTSLNCMKGNRSPGCAAASPLGLFPEIVENDELENCGF